MANPWWILGAWYLLGRSDSQSKVAEENARRLDELEKIVRGEQPAPPKVTANDTDFDGCLGCCGCLVALGFLAFVLLVIGWMVFG